jgi:hypothetical protein
MILLRNFLHLPVGPSNRCCATTTLWTFLNKMGAKMMRIRRRVYLLPSKRWSYMYCFTLPQILFVWENLGDLL